MKVKAQNAILKSIKVVCFTIVFASGIQQQLNAQIMPQSSLYMFNQFAWNPAVAGSKECYDIHAGFRAQHVGIDENPTNIYANYQNRLRRKNVSVNENFAGVGFNVYSFTNRPLSETAITAAYAYNLRVSTNARMAVGIASGFMFHSFNADGRRVRDGGDPILEPGNSFVLPLINPGVFYYNRNFFAGIAAMQMFANNISDFGTDESRLRTNWNMNFGGKIPTKTNFSLLPSAMLRLINGLPTSVDVNLLADYNNIFAFGLGYRNQDAVMGIFRIKTKQGINIGYAFDFVTSGLAPVARNSHEIIITFTPCDKKKTPLSCPVFE
ncbi:MAG: PorP/SprF family type IX secretion system membrane protein [Luteibaculaceae bacterium]